MNKVKLSKFERWIQKRVVWLDDLTAEDRVGVGAIVALVSLYVFWFSLL